MVKKPKIVTILGPTAAGKTLLALAFAQKLDVEIVSTDSRQIYRGMDIGTAKPSAKELNSIPHHLINIKKPDENYSVADYKKDAIATINNILSRGKLPLLVGGTGLYIKTVLENLDIPRTSANPILRAEIEKDIERDGLEAVFKRLAALDPDAKNSVDAKNPRRVVRALEVTTSTGKPFTAQQKKYPPLFDALIFGLNPPTEILRERIDRRVDEMIDTGLVKEVADLLKEYGSNTVAFNTIGYREIMDHLAGTITLHEAIAAIKLNTWHYARRQMTWFKKTPGVRWVKNNEEAIKYADTFFSASTL